MKKTFKNLGILNRDRRSKAPLLIIALVAIIGFSMVACGGGGSSDSYDGDFTKKGTDTDVNRNVPKNAKDIPEITKYPKFKDYKPVESKKDLGYVDDIFNNPEDFIPNFSLGPSRVVLKNLLSYARLQQSGRKVVSESVNITLSNMKIEPKELRDLILEEGGELPKPVPGLTGYIKGSSSYDDVNGFPIKANGSAEYRYEINEPIDDGEFAVIGYIAGEAKVSSVELNYNEKTGQESMKGSASASVTLSVNVADTYSKKYAKLICTVGFSMNLSKETYTVNYSYEAYGDDPKTPIYKDKDSYTYSMSDYMDDYGDW